MRQRKVKNEEQRLAALEHMQVKNSCEICGQWSTFIKGKHEPFNGKIYLEAGCGRGHFLASLAKNSPDSFYLGAEGRSSVVLRAMELISDEELENVLFIPELIVNFEDYFSENELAGIYLNFSDPWPKARHAKRRLTHRNYLKGYRKALVSDGFIEFKTDSEPLFEFTLDECRAEGFTIEKISRDLHKSDLSARLITSQYEHRFRLLGKPIYYCRITV